MHFVRNVVGLTAILAIVAGCQQPTTTPVTTQNASTQASPATPVERGKYLTLVGGCNDCHTPKTFRPNGAEADMKRELSGHPAEEKFAGVSPKTIERNQWGTVTNSHLTAWSGPWGVSFAMNLTPDKTTGLGSWTPEMFVSAIRSGKHQGTGRPILPPMPWNWYRNMTDDDLKAVFAYLQSLPPIHNPVPDPIAPE